MADGRNGMVPTARRQPPSISSPDNDRQVASLIARLLLHFWSPGDLSDKARAAMAADWVEDLREYGPEHVATACMTWRRTQTKRPTPADLRRLAIEARQDATPDQLALPSPAHREAAAENRRRREHEIELEGRSIVTEWARERGFDNLDAYAAAHNIGIDMAYRHVIGSKLEGSPIAAAMGSALSGEPQHFTRERMVAGRRALGLEHDDGATP